MNYNNCKKNKFYDLLFNVCIFIIWTSGLIIILYYSIKFMSSKYCKKNYETSTIFNITENYNIGISDNKYIVYCDAYTQNNKYCHYYIDEFAYYNQADDCGKNNCYNYTMTGYYRNEKCYLKKTCQTTNNYYIKKILGYKIFIIFIALWIIFGYVSSFGYILLYLFA